MVLVLEVVHGAFESWIASRRGRIWLAAARVLPRASDLNMLSRALRALAVGYDIRVDPRVCGPARARMDGSTDSMLSLLSRCLLSHFGSVVEDLDGQHKRSNAKLCVSVHSTIKQ